MPVRSLVRSALVLGSSSAANMLVAVLRVKLLALMIGPSGLAVLGTLAGIASSGTTLAAVGADISATRRLALARDNPDAIRRIRRVLLAIAALHGLAAVLLLVIASDEISRWAFGTTAYAFQVAVLGPAVALTLLAGLQIAVLQGLGRVSDIARVSLVSTLIGTAAALLAVWTWGIPGLVVVFLVQPAVAAALAAHAYRASGEGREPSTRGGGLAPEWRSIIAAGAPFMLSSLALALLPLAVRVLVIHEAGLDAAGHFHAAWTMSVVYVGFLLSAMSADYYPRLTGLVADRRAATDLVNDQVQVSLAIGGPILLAMLAGAPWLIPLLYSQAFEPAAGVLVWQAFGNLMKIAAWPLAFIAMARGRSWQFIALDISWSAAFLLIVWLTLPVLGLDATGIAFAAACVLFLGAQTVAARATVGFRWRPAALRLLAAFLAAGLLTMAAGRHSPLLQVVTGGTFALALGLTGLRDILGRVGTHGRIPTYAGRFFAALGWPVATPAMSAAARP
jgi:PST family polysaccharide transporter